MTNVTHHEPGTFCWPELYTTDPAGAKAFYSGLFGWRVKDIPMGPDAAYTIFTLDARDAAACYGAPPQAGPSAPRPHWIAYVAVASADEAGKRVRSAEGTVVKEPFDVPGIGRMAAFQDPTGAAFCVWEARGHNGVGVVDEPGALVWTELLTTDLERAGAFYGHVFGWSRNLWPMADGSSYTLFMRGAAAAGGMIAITPEMGAVRPVWVSYFLVGDCDATAVKAVATGGRIEVPPQSVPNVGRFAVLVDPAGAHFGIMTRGSGR